MLLGSVLELKRYGLAAASGLDLVSELTKALLQNAWSAYTVLIPEEDQTIREHTLYIF